MKRSNGRLDADASECLPLCRRYLSVHAGCVPTVVQMNGVSGGGVEVYWVVGNLSRDESEILGVWAKRDWKAALVELQDRGVERVQFALDSDSAGFQENLRARFPGATALPSFAQLLDRSVSQVAARHRSPVAERLRAIVETESGTEARAALAAFESSRWGVRYPVLVAGWRIALEQGWALWSLTPALRREVLSGDGRAAALNRSLRKAVDRRGGFADAGAAAEFVKAVLAREQRRMEGVPVAGATEPSPLRDAFGSRMSALGI